MNQGQVIILGIETSCDETAAAVAIGRRTTAKPLVDGSRWTVGLLSNIVASQIDLHAATGGVVPEVAARAHVEAIIPVIEQSLVPLLFGGAKRPEIYESKNSKFESRNSKQIQNPNHPNSKRLEFRNLINQVDAIAVTTGPGLIGSLLIGIETAKTLAYVFQKPIIPVNHLEGHIYANFADEIPKSKFQNPNNFQISNQLQKKIQFPALVLIVSGGHTELVVMKDHLKYELVGQTRDDAAGECFDKSARLLGLPYPGGPALSKLAQHGDPKAFDFPRPMINSGDFDFSFSGLKTAVYYKIRELEISKLAGETNSLLADLAASAQQAIVDVLVAKTIAAANQRHAKTVMISGGVAANQLLRGKMAEMVHQALPTVTYRQPNLDLATDNAGMIAIAGVYRYLRGATKNWYDVEVDANASLV